MIDPAAEALISIPTDVIYQAPAPVPKDFNVGDRIEVRREAPGEPLELALGVVAIVRVGSLTLGTRVYKPIDGWAFSLVERAPLVLPARLSEIDAETPSGRVRLMGKGRVWTTEAGEVIDPAIVQSFEVVPDPVAQEPVLDPALEPVPEPVLP